MTFLLILVLCLASDPTDCRRVRVDREWQDLRSCIAASYTAPAAVMRLNQRAVPGLPQMIYRSSFCISEAPEDEGA